MKGIEVAFTTNVSIRVINGNDGSYKDYFYHNKATKSLLLGMWKFLRGDITQNNANDYAPNWLEVGAGTSTPLFTDTKLQTPLYEDGTQADHYQSGTVIFASPQRGKDYTEDTNSITFGVKFYLESEDVAGTQADPTPINEMGLYSGGDAPKILLARVVFDDTIEKHENDFVDILWEISMTAVN